MRIGKSIEMNEQLNAEDIFYKIIIIATVIRGYVSQSKINNAVPM